MIRVLQDIGWFVGLVLLQAWILNQIHLFGYATPFLYVYLILKFESDTPRNALMLWAFLLGLTVDIFSDTPGMNAASAVLLAFARPTLLLLFTPRDMPDAFTPAIRTLGLMSFLKYVAIGVLLHHILLFSLEYFTLAHILELLIRILSSSLLTVACIMALEGFTNDKQ